MNQHVNWKVFSPFTNVLVHMGSSTFFFFGLSLCFMCCPCPVKRCVRRRVLRRARWPKDVHRPCLQTRALALPSLHHLQRAQLKTTSQDPLLFYSLDLMLKMEP